MAPVMDDTTFSDDDSHPCEKSDCDRLVPYDDEPWCFDHSPDSGSHVSGYSYKNGTRYMLDPE